MDWAVFYAGQMVATVPEEVADSLREAIDQVLDDGDSRWIELNDEDDQPTEQLLITPGVAIRISRVVEEFDPLAFGN